MDYFKLYEDLLTHSFPMHPFSTPWKHQKSLQFSDAGTTQSAVTCSKFTMKTLEQGVKYVQS